MIVSPATAPLIPQALESATGAAGAGTSSFGAIVDKFLGSAVHRHAEAENAVRDLALGQTDNIHGVLLQVAQADLAFRLVLEIRNRLTEAYQDIMKMQV